MSLKTFFNPESIAIIGLSENSEKLSAIICQNLLDAKFEGEIFGINPKLSGKKIGEIPCFGHISEIKEPLDLAVFVIPSKFVESGVDECIKNKTKNIIIISAGFSEVGNTELETKIQAKCAKNNINLLGPNCLGLIVPNTKLNASFSDGFPKKGKIAFISQSGAFCTAMLDWADQKNIGFSHFVSLGNKAGISEIEILENLSQDPQVEILAFYLESLRDGKTFCEKIKNTQKPVIILEPGKSKKANEASSSHTGSLAPNARVLEKAYEKNGAIQVFSMREMFAVLEILNENKTKNFGNNVAVITNAGGVGVLSADLSEQNHLNLTEITPQIKQKLETKLPQDANTKNPIDIIGDAKSDRYRDALEILIKDPKVEQILVLLTPQRTTEPEKTAKIIAEINQKTKKFITASFIGGTAVKKGIKILENNKVPHFEFPVDALNIMGILSHWQKNKPTIPKPEESQKQKSLSRVCNQNSKSLEINQILETPKIKKQITEFFTQAKKENLKSLSQKSVDAILESLKINYPKSKNFSINQFKEAQEFAQNIWPQKIVLKISSPQALHKTDLQGVFLNIKAKEKFKTAWENLKNTIENSKIQKASIQIQQQIEKGTEVILGINEDQNFGRIMLFGSGGIYAEIYQDTALEIFPIQDFENLIDQTKVSKILRGTRGEKPKAIQKLTKTMEKIQWLVQNFPEIKSIDANPIILTETEAICVDFKIIL